MRSATRAYKKRRFTPAERYVVWNAYGKRCGFCEEPLVFKDATIDHVIPESLLNDDSHRQKVFIEYGLNSDFKINGFGNWLPCHSRCNQKKGDVVPSFVPGNKAILDRLAAVAPNLEVEAKALVKRAKGGKMMAILLTAIEAGKIAPSDLKTIVRSEMVRLDSGYWLANEDIALEAECRCDRSSCVGHQGKVFCIFSKMLSSWVIKTGLFWRCYDESILCPRCSNTHKRGHVGAAAICGNPFKDQERQVD